MSDVELKRIAKTLIDKLLVKPVPDEVKDFYKRNLKDSNEAGLDVLETMQVWNVCTQRLVESYVSKVKTRARRKGIEVLDALVSCAKKKDWCFTCLSNLYPKRFRVHGPYLYRKVENNGGRRDWRKIKEKEMRDFLRMIDFTEEEIQGYEYAVELRKHFLRLHNYYMITLKHIGSIEENDIVERGGTETA